MWRENMGLVEVGVGDKDGGESMGAYWLGEVAAYMHRTRRVRVAMIWKCCPRGLGEGPNLIKHEPITSTALRSGHVVRS